jgi:hypothetical protein
MANLPTNQNLVFDTELTLSPTFTNVPQLLGILQNNPVIILVKNQTNQTIFFADNNGSTKGTTMVAGESFVLDCRGNAGKAMNMGFGAGTAFYATVPAAGTGSVKVGILYAN